MSYTINSACPGCAACVRVCPVGAIQGERKAVHVIDPAVCIDCGACGRICPYHVVLDEQDRLCRMIKRNLWLRPVIFEGKCVSCGVCLEVCPTSVLDFAPLTDHRLRALPWLVHAPNCIGCSFCEAACPVEAIQMQAGSEG